MNKTLIISQILLCAIFAYGVEKYQDIAQERYAFELKMQSYKSAEVLRFFDNYNKVNNNEKIIGQPKPVIPFRLKNEKLKV